MLPVRIDQRLHRRTAIAEFASESDDTASAIRARDHKEATDLITRTVPIAVQERAGAKSESAGPQSKGWQEDIAYTLEGRHGVQAVAFAENQRGEVRAVGGDGDITNAIADHSGKLGQGEPTIAFTAQDRLGDVREECSPTLRAGNHGESKPNGGVVPAITYREAVRRLTPRECERLQGFPDDYTCIPYGSKRKIDAFELEYLRRVQPGLTLEEAQRTAADSPRFRALGNSMAVPVMQWIGERIAIVDAIGETK